MDRLEPDASGLGRHWQVLRGLRVRLHLGDFEGSNASHDGLIAGHDYLVGCENLLQQRRDFLGLGRRWDDRIVSDEDHVDHVARRAAPSPDHCVRGGEGAG